jgi:signal transduction histidine kinase
MRLANFIADHIEPILGNMDAFATTQAHPSQRARREHALQMLHTIVQELSSRQSSARPPHVHSAPQSVHDSVHACTPHAEQANDGAVRFASGLTIDELLVQYRALRCSVLQLWMGSGRTGLSTDAEDLIGFNEALDQALARSVTGYASMVKHAQNLFLAILGHDLRNPLNTTLVAARMLMMAPDILRQHASVAAQIQRSGMRMGRLLDDLIDYTRTHLGSALPMTLGAAHMGRICAAIVDEFRQANPDRRIAYEVGNAFDMALDSASSRQLDGVWDEGRISQAFSNLLGNALQHGACGEPVQITLRSLPAELELRVHNGGEPIAPEALPMIFDPMVRLARTADHDPARQTSLGIGLYIARTIVEAHGGTITVSSSEHEGTTFAVHLPRWPPDAPCCP